MKAQQWEYTTIATDNDSQGNWEKWLGAMGSVGWELTTIIPSGRPDLPWLCFFKRPKVR